MKNNLFITSADGKLYQYYDGNLNIVYDTEKDEMLTGITRNEDKLYLAGDSNLYCLSFIEEFKLAVEDIVSVPKVNPLFSNCKIINNRLFVASTAMNGFYVFNQELDSLRHVRFLM